MKGYIFFLMTIFLISQAIGYSYNDTNKDNNFSLNLLGNEGVNGALYIGDAKIAFDNNNARIEHNCIRRGESFFERSECQSNCTAEGYNCVLRDDKCYYCIRHEPEPFYIKIINKIKKFFKGLGNNKKAQAKKAGAILGEEEKKGLENAIAEELIGNTDKVDAPAELSENIGILISNAKSLDELIRLKMYIDEYCYRTGDISNNFENEECKSLRIKLKKKADEFKDKEFKSIDPFDPEGLNKMMQLQALLMAYDKASGGSSLFSDDNVNKVRRGIKKKARIWWKNYIKNDYKSISELWEDLVLAEAFTPASYGHGKGCSFNENDSSIFGNSACELKKDVQEQANRAVTSLLFDIDICNPDKDKLDRLKEQLFNRPSRNCEELLDSKAACDSIEKGDLQAAYKECYNKGKFGENNPKNLPKPPIDCKKKVSESEELVNNNNSTKTNYSGSANHSLDDNITNKEEAYTGQEDNEERDIQETNEDEQSPEENQSNPTEADYDCIIELKDDPVIGFDFELNGCDKQPDDIIECFIVCGHEPPLVYAQEEGEEQVLCYETMEGFVDEEAIIPCFHRPMPPEDITGCLSECAQGIVIE